MKIRCCGVFMWFMRYENGGKDIVWWCPKCEQYRVLKNPDWREAE